jgi:hypothetical protein
MRSEYRGIMHVSGYVRVCHLEFHLYLYRRNLGRQATRRRGLHQVTTLVLVPDTHLPLETEIGIILLPATDHGTPNNTFRSHLTDQLSTSERKQLLQIINVPFNLQNLIDIHHLDKP